MKKTDRHDIARPQEGQCEPGGAGEVPRNLLGIRSRGEIDLAETRELLRATDRLLERYDRDHQFAAADIRDMHRCWLASIYAWAGCYRMVYLNRDGSPFASPAHIPLMMEAFETNILGRYTPCTFASRDEVVEALAVVHCELLLIHPFRDGNGRIARVLAMLMALQAGLPLLDFGELAEEKKDAYFAAVHSGQEMDYAPMEKLFRGIIARSERSAAPPV